MINFSLLFLGDGEVDGVRIFKPEIMEFMVTPNDAEEYPGYANRTPVFWYGDDNFGSLEAHRLCIGHPGSSGSTLVIDRVNQITSMQLSSSGHLEAPQRQAAIDTLYAQIKLGAGNPDTPDPEPVPDDKPGSTSTGVGRSVWPWAALLSAGGGAAAALVCRNRRNKTKR